MTQNYNALTVALEHDIREDDAENLLTAIRQLRGVASVSGNVSSIDSYTAESRAKHEWVTKLLELIRDSS